MLFKDTARFKAFFPTVNKNMAWETLSPFVAIAEQRYIVPLLGSDQYAALDNAYTAAANETLLTTNEKALLEKVRWPLAYYTAFIAMPNLLTMVSDMGITEQQSTGGNATPSRQWVFESQYSETEKSAEAFADMLLSWLETNRATYPQWANSTARTINQKLLIDSTATLEHYVYVNQSRRAWLHLRPFTEQVEQDYILPALGADFWAEIQTAMLGTPSANQQKLIDRLRRAVATMAVGFALPRMALTATAGGALYAQTGDINFTNEEARRQQQIAIDYVTRGQGYLSEAKKWLDENASLFTTYQASTAVGNGEAPYNLPNNSASKNSFMI